MDSTSDGPPGFDLGPQLAEAQERIYTHPAFIAHYEIEALAQAIFGVLVPNAKELLGLLLTAATNEDLAFELMQNVRAPTVRENWEARTIRALHNYVASSASVVDHVRRVMRGREGPIAERFETKRLATVEHPEMAFVRDLRNYTLHRSLPSLGFSLTMKRKDDESEEWDMTAKVYLHTEELFRWEGWKADSRAFLESLEDGQVHLFPTFETHVNQMVRLNGSLCNALGEAIDYDALNALVEEANAVLTGGDMDEARRMSERWTTNRNDPVGPTLVDGRIEHASDRDVRQ